MYGEISETTLNDEKIEKLFRIEKCSRLLVPIQVATSQSQLIKVAIIVTDKRVILWHEENLFVGSSRTDFGKVLAGSKKIAEKVQEGK